MFELSIETRLPCLYGLEKKQGMTSSLFAESYWPSCVSIGRVALYWPSLSLIWFGPLLPYAYCITDTVYSWNNSELTSYCSYTRPAQPGPIRWLGPKQA